MKTKKIEFIINEKFNSWVNTIKIESVKNLVLQNTILTGGSICSMFLNEPINDFDFYFKNKETAKAVAQYYVDQFKTKHNPTHKNGQTIDISVTDIDDRIAVKIKSAGVASDSATNDYQYFEQQSEDSSTQEYVSNLTTAFVNTKKENVYFPIFMSSNAITLSDDVQLVLRFYGDPKSIHENYDFVHCTNYWESDTKKITVNANALECILGKELKYVGSKYPIASLFRTSKFIKRGWHITAGQMLKIIMQISALDLKNINVLQEQLIGVDVAYFHEIIEKLRSSNPNAVDTAYLIKLIDEMF